MHELSYSLSRGITEITIGKTVKEYIEVLADKSLIVYPHSISEIIEPIVHEFSFPTYKLDDGEEGKSLDSVIGIIRAMKEAGFKRSSTIVSVGGGSVSDAVGMAASMYMRGVNYVSIPTTLLSMVDASLGGKNAVNLDGVKNLLGSFFSPSRIGIDTSLVGGMPQGLITDGMGEIAKYALILDSELYQLLSSEPLDHIFGDVASLETLVEKCIRDKMEIVEKDEFDLLGKRIVLNFGHTIGHAIESATDFSMGHGTAVANGMLLEMDMGVEMGLIDRSLLHSAGKLLERLNLPHKIDSSFISGIKERMADVISSDKKATGTSVKIPLPEETGVPRVFEVRLQEVNDYLDRLSK